jgi:antitoxin component YwqK of YwqJK toxin-antitoxin module
MSGFRIHVRYSLRSLLIVVTLFAVGLGGGMAWWQRIQVGDEILVQSNWQHEARLMEEQWAREADGRPGDAGLHCHMWATAADYLAAHPNTEPTYKVVYHYYRGLQGERVRHGVSSTYDLEGRLLRAENWRHGRLHGPWTDWHPDGSKLAEGDYRLGERHGTWVSYRRDIPREFPQVRDVWACCGNRHGSRDQRGEPYPETLVEQYVEGKRTSVAGWDAAYQRLVFEAQCDGDALHGTLTWRLAPNGTLTDEVQLKMGVLAGPARGWYKSGALDYEGTFQADKNDGRWTWWYEDGTKADSGEFRAGVKEGVWTSWHPNGNKRETGTFRAGRQDGNWTWSDAGGVVECEAQYDDGLVTKATFPQLSQDIPIQGLINLDCARTFLAAVSTKVDCQFDETPFEDVVKFFAAWLNVPAEVNYSAILAAGHTIKADSPISYTMTQSSDGQHSGVTLKAVLEQILKRYDLLPVLRNEMLLITTRADAQAWRDRSGVPRLFRSTMPTLVKELRETTVAFDERLPLRDVCQRISDYHGIKLRVDPYANDELSDLPIMATLTDFRDRALASLLAFLCDQYSLTCVDTGTEVLVRRAAVEH